MGKIAIGCFAGGVHFGTSVKLHSQWIHERLEDSEGEACQRDSAGNLPCAWDACVHCGISKIKAAILINIHPTTTTTTITTTTTHDTIGVGRYIF